MNTECKIRAHWPPLAYSLLLGLLLSGCDTMESGSHHDESASFDSYRNFSWIADEPLIVGAGDDPSVNPLMRKMIVGALEDELTRKGFVYTANRDTADFVVSYTVGTRERIELTSYPTAYRGVEVAQHMYTEGTLGVDIFDGKTKQPVWHGWATKTILTSDRQDPSLSIKKAVTAIFAQFPPVGTPSA